MNKQVPTCIEIERELLGSILLDPEECMPQVCETIEINDFYKQAHRTIYRQLLNLYNNNVDIDLVMLIDFLRQDGELEQVGSEAYIAGLMAVVGTAAYYEGYAKIVKEKSLLRKAIEVAQKMLQSAYDQRDLLEIIPEVEQGLLELSKGSSAKDTWLDSPKVAALTDEKLQDFSKNEGITGLPSGYPSIDKLTTGFHKGTLNVIGAASSMGKTALAISIAINIAYAQKKKVAIFSLEMSAADLGIRIVSRRARIDMQRLRRGDISLDSDKEKKRKAIIDLARQGIFIDQDSGTSLSDISSRSKRLMIKHEYDILIIDYLQLIDAPKAGTREQQVSSITRGLKKLSGDLDIPIIALSQLSRAVESRPDKRPVLNDLRESGSIAQDADLVMFIYRDEYYYKEESEKRGIAEIIIGKQRNGPIGTVELSFLGSQVRFVDPLDTF